MDEPKMPWHLDKRIPIAFLLAIMAQTGAMFWYFGQLDERVTTTERWINDNKKIAAQLAVLDERTSSMKSDLVDIKLALTRLGELQWHQERP